MLLHVKIDFYQKFDAPIIGSFPSSLAALAAATSAAGIDAAANATRSRIRRMHLLGLQTMPLEIDFKTFKNNFAMFFSSLGPFPPNFTLRGPSAPSLASQVLQDTCETQLA